MTARYDSAQRNPGHYAPIEWPAPTARRSGIDLFDLASDNAKYMPEILDALTRVACSGKYVGTDDVWRFEREFARTHGHDFRCVGVSSGLDALRLALIALNAKRVAAPVLTFAATWEAIVQAGATIVPVDVTDDGLIDSAAVAQTRCDVVLAVHLHGALAPLGAIRDEKPDAALVEDAAHAAGAWGEERDGEYEVGLDGEATCYSFYPTKPLGAMGDGGAVVTRGSRLAARIMKLREHGKAAGDIHHSEVGYTARLDAMQAAVLSVKLPDLSERNRARRENAWCYSALLGGVGDIRLPRIGLGHAAHVYAIRTQYRDLLRLHLHEHGIRTGLHYSPPLHHQIAFRPFNVGGSFPVAERIARETLSIPCYPTMPLADIERVANVIKEFFTVEKGQS